MHYINNNIISIILYLFFVILIFTKPFPHVSYNKIESNFFFNNATNVVNFETNSKKKIDKIFIKFQGNLNSRTSYHPENLNFFNKKKLIHSHNTKYFLNKSTYELIFKNPIEIENFKINFFGEGIEIKNIILFEKNDKIYLSLIEKIFHIDNFNIFSYLTYSLVILIYFLFFVFVVREFSFSALNIKIELLYLIPIFIFSCILINFINLYFDRFNYFFNLFLITIFFYYRNNFKYFLKRYLRIILLMFFIFLIVQIPMIIVDLNFDYIGVVKGHLYDFKYFLLNEVNFLGYHYDSNLIWITSKIFQNSETLNNANLIFLENSIPFKEIQARPFIYHNFISYFYELFNLNSHFLFVRLQYFFLTLIYLVLLLISKDKFNFNYSITILILLILNGSILFNGFPSFEIMNKIHPFLFLALAVYSLEKKKLNLSILFIIMGGIIHISGIFYVIAFSFALLIYKQINLLAIFRFLFAFTFIIYFHLNQGLITQNFFNIQESKEIYFSRLFNISDFNYYEIFITKIVNMLNIFIPLLNNLKLGKSDVSFEYTLFGCLLLFYLFFFIKKQNQSWYNFLVTRLFVFSPILFLILSWDANFVRHHIYYFLFVSFYVIIYFFDQFKNSSIFIYAIFSSFIYSSIVNINRFYIAISEFNSSQAILIYYIFCFFNLCILIYLFNIFNLLNRLNLFIIKKNRKK